MNSYCTTGSDKEPPQVWTRNHHGACTGNHCIREVLELLYEGDRTHTQELVLHHRFGQGTTRRETGAILANSKIIVSSKLYFLTCLLHVGGGTADSPSQMPPFQQPVMGTRNTSHGTSQQPLPLFSTLCSGNATRGIATFQIPPRPYYETCMLISTCKP